MFSLAEKFSSLGTEFNKELRRNDGEFVAKILYGRLEQDIRDWIYDRVLRIFDGLSEAEWSGDDQSMSELRSRNEVSCFQAIETAIVARDSGYVPADKAEWFADWCLRLTLGVGAPDAKRHRFPHYWNKGQDERVAAFCAVLAAVLPETAYSYYFIVLYNRLLLLLTKATVATYSFGRTILGGRGSLAPGPHMTGDGENIIRAWSSGPGPCVTRCRENQQWLRQDGERITSPESIGGADNSNGSRKPT